MKSVIKVIGATFLFLFPLGIGHADKGENCSVDITSNFRIENDWRSADVVRGSDGYTWKRATIGSPSSVLEIEEGVPSQIKGIAESLSDVQILIFAPDIDTSGNVKKPGLGSCFDAGISTTSGTYSFEINARMLWGAIEDSVVIDTYYKTDTPWEIMTQEKTKQSNQTFFIGSTLPPKILKIEGKFQENQEGCSIMCESAGMLKGLSLDIKNISAELLGNNLDAIGGEKIVLGRKPGPHTFYISVDGQTPPTDTWIILQRVVYKALGMESLKRTLLANPNTNGIPSGLPEFRADLLIEAANGQGSYSSRTQELVKNIKTILISRDFSTREEAAQKISTLVGEQNNQSLFRASLVREVLIPDVSTESTWADDFVEIMRFWSGKNIQNTCLMEDDDELWKNYISANTQMSGNICSFMFINGQTPTLTLYTDEQIKLEPKFSQTRITFADKIFQPSQEWVFKKDEKKTVSYLYNFLRPFHPLLGEKSCLKKKDIDTYTQNIKKAFGLLDSEGEIVKKELSTAISTEKKTYEVHLANPKDIQTRFAWVGNGKPLHLLQLFFQIREKECLPFITDNFNAEMRSIKRDGFEAGIL